jgi:hypothetical protein
MANAVNYLWWQAESKRESFADTFAAALRAHEARFGRAATVALVPVGMAAVLGPQLWVEIEEREHLPPGTVMVR